MERLFCAQKSWLVRAVIQPAYAGYEGLVLVIRCATFVWKPPETPVLAKQATSRWSPQVSCGLSGLEWLPPLGTAGGAVYGNAGAFGSDVNQSLLVADILQPDGKKCQVSAADMVYSHRSSALKPHERCVLSARFRLSVSTARRPGQIPVSTERRCQNRPRRSMGSMFKILRRLCRQAD